MSKENVETIKITSEYITLGQFLKFTNVISNGGEAKFFIANNKIFLNGQQIFERGKKLRSRDQININDRLFFEIE